MIMKNNNKKFWKGLDSFVRESEIVIDRPKGTAHPKYPDIIYPIDYGYLKGTTSMDGGGIDIWIGTHPQKNLDAILCIIDGLKKDSEIKILLGCTEKETDVLYNFHNDKYMSALLIQREYG